MLKRLLTLAALGAVFSFPALGQTVADPGFETPAQGQGILAYRPAGSTWAFTGSAGLSGNDSGMSVYGPAAPQGAQVAFLQNSAHISQTIPAWPAGSYQVAFRAIQRQNWPSPGGSHQTISVLLDGHAVSTVTPAGTTYQLYHSAVFPVAAGDHTLAFSTAAIAGADNTGFLDAVEVISAASITSRVTSTATVTSSGKMIAFSFAALADGKPVVPSQILAPPSITINGQALGQLGAQWLTGYHPVALLAVPGGYQIRPGAVVQITSPVAWAYAGVDAVGGLDAAPVENRAGKPMTDVAHKLRIGVNNNQLPTSSNLGFYWPFVNIAPRVGWPPKNRGPIGNPPVSLQLSNNGMSNGIDGTCYPGIAGLWLVMWDVVDPKSDVQFSLATATPNLCSITERVDLQRKPADGIGCCRAFDVQPVPGAPSANFDVSLSYVDTQWAGTAHYSKLWVVQPGDWDLKDGAAVLDRSDPLALSRLYIDRIGQGVGSLRWVDSTITGGNPVSAPYPELLPSVTDENWGDLAFRQEIRGYTAAGPVDVAATPYLYSPFFRQPEQQFKGVLGTETHTPPAPGTREVWTITDAPLMAGLEITAGTEVCRIISGSGTSWTVVRGSNGTTPTAHAAGPVSISGRRPIRDVLDASGGIKGGLTVQLTLSTPHGRTTGNTFGCGGGGWPTITFTDGATWNPQNTVRACYVNGPNTFIMSIGSTAAGGVPDRVYPLDPNAQQWDYRVNGGIPVEAAAIATGKFPHADLHVNVPLDAVDDMVYEIARRVLANFPAGRRVYVEYSNEPWNWSFTGFYYHTSIMTLAVPDGTFQLRHYAHRAGQVHQIFRSVFAAAGRAGEVRGLLNCQMGSGSSQMTPYLDYGHAHGTPFDDVAIAPYWHFEDTTLNRQAAAALDDDQLVDVIGADQRTNPKYHAVWIKDAHAAIDAYNTAHGEAVKLYGYEGGIEFATQWDEKRNHDLIYNPVWYFVEMDWLAWCQQSRLERLNVYSLAQWWNPHGWGGYHTSQQRHSRGDGLNGAKDNRAVKAKTKPSNVNHDSQVDSVRGQAWLDWLGTITP